MRRLELMCATLTASLVVGCAGASSPTSTTGDDTTTTVVETTTTIRNPYLDVVEVPSNFDPGEAVDVVGVAYDDRSWIRNFPSDDSAFSGLVWEVDRLVGGLIATGIAVTYQDGPVWERFDRDDLIGFFPQENTGVIGAAVDITKEAADLQAASADDLITLVAETIAAREGLEPVQITQRPFGGREVYFDLIGSTDSLSRGFRLRVVVAEDGDTFRVELVEQSIICVSGIDDGGGCT